MIRWLKFVLSKFLRNLSCRREQTSIYFEDPVGAALDDAEILVAFAAQSYRKIEPSKIAKLIGWVEAIRTSRQSNVKIPANTLSNFWISYDALAADMAPLSAHSIKSTAHLDCQRLPKSVFTPTGYNALFAGAILLLCLMLQGFWVAGRELLNQAADIEREREKVVERLQVNNNSLQRAKAKVRSIEYLCDLGKICFLTETSLTNSRKSSGASDLIKWTALRSQFIAAQQEVEEQTNLVNSLNVELERISERSRPLEQLFQKWYARAGDICNRHVLEYVCPIKSERADSAHILKLRQSIEDIRQRIAETSLHRPSASLNNKARVPPVFNTDDAWTQYKANSQMRDDLTSLQVQLVKSENDRFRSLVVEVRMLVQNLGTYFIAMLMGMLGALAYIIRSISSQLREHTYVPFSFSSSFIRICLGAIAGVFGGLQAADGNSGLNEVPSLFIPFVFGYGIEILFSLLDRIVHSLTHTEQKTATG